MESMLTPIKRAKSKGWDNIQKKYKYLNMRLLDHVQVLQRDHSIQ